MLIEKCLFYYVYFIADITGSGSKKESENVLLLSIHY